MNEIEVLNRIDHPNVVKLHEMFEDAQNFYMVLELMKGGSLQSRLVDHQQKVGKLTESEIHKIIQPIVDAMAYCHEENIVHRDLKVSRLSPAGQHTIREQTDREEHPQSVGLRLREILRRREPVADHFVWFAQLCR